MAAPAGDSHRQSVDGPDVGLQGPPDHGSNRLGHRPCWTPQRVLSELRRSHDAGQPLAYSQVQRRAPPLAWAARKFFGTYGKAVEAAGFDYSEVRRDARVWTPERIIQILHELYRGGADMRSSQVNERLPGLESAARTCFGSYRGAIVAAGLHYPPLRIPPGWTAQRVLQELRDRYARGEELRYSRVLKTDPKLATAAKYHYQSYGAAVRKAQIDYRYVARRHAERERAPGAPPRLERIERPQPWTPQRVVEELRRLRDAGENLRTTNLRDHHAALLQQVYCHFGSFRKAMAAAGVEPSPCRFRGAKRRWDRESVLNAIRDVYRGGERLTLHEIDRSAPGLMRATQKLFGRWSDAARAAGIPESVVRERHATHWTPQLVTAELRRLHEAGQDMRSGPLHRDHLGVVIAGRRLFGSYRAALKAAQIDPDSINPFRHWTCQTVISELRRLHREGADLHRGGVQQYDASLYYAALEFFDSWEAALRAADIDPASLPPPDPARRAKSLLSRPRPNAVQSTRPDSQVGDRDRPAARSPLQRQTRERVLEELRHRQSTDADPATEAKPATIWTRQRVLEELRERQAAGLDLRPSVVFRERQRLYEGARRQFGSWWAALDAIGVRPESLPPPKHWRWSPQRVIEQLQQRQAVGMPLNSGAIQKTDSALAGAIRARFGSHDAALRAAGIDPETVHQLRVWTPESVLDAVRTLHQQMQAMDTIELNRNDPGLFGAMRRHFGSHRKALEAAGIDPELVLRKAWTRERVIEELRALADRFPGGVVSYNGLKDLDSRLCHAARMHFGGVSVAVRAAGLPYGRKPRTRTNTLEHWTDQSVLETLRELHAAGTDLRYRVMKTKRQPLFFAARERFGSYVNAVQQAGIDYGAMSREQLDRELSARAASAQAAGLATEA